jgi:PTH1 family peptidyl-tRNA hydrolase
MNNSGECIKQFLHYFSINSQDLLIIHDELALPLGSFRYRTSGSSGGHNGIKNIIEILETSEFKRLRIGIGRDEKVIIRQWVLQKFNKGEIETLKQLFPLLAESAKE